MEQIVSDLYGHKWPDGCAHCGFILSDGSKCEHGVAYCTECLQPADPAGCKHCDAEAAGLICDMCGCIMRKPFRADVGNGEADLCYHCSRRHRPRPSRREARNRRGAKNLVDLGMFVPHPLIKDQSKRDSLIESADSINV